MRVNLFNVEAGRLWKYPNGSRDRTPRKLFCQGGCTWRVRPRVLFQRKFAGQYPPWQHPMKIWCTSNGEWIKENTRKFQIPWQAMINKNSVLPTARPVATGGARGAQPPWKNLSPLGCAVPFAVTIGIEVDPPPRNSVSPPPANDTWLQRWLPTCDRQRLIRIQCSQPATSND